MRLSLDWATLAEVVVVLTAVGGAHLAWLRMSLRSVFASKRGQSDLIARMETVEERLRGMATHHDVRELAARVDEIRRNVSVQEANLQGIRDSLDRVEHMVNLLLTSQLENGA